ncbi:MAG: hypothetical protein ABIQ95_02600 [Bdellovibrionia bacterium]
MIKALLFLPLSFVFVLSSALAAPSDSSAREPERVDLSGLQMIAPEIADEIQKQIETQREHHGNPGAQKREEKLKRKQEERAKTELARREAAEQRRAEAERVINHKIEKLESEARYARMKQWDKAERKQAEFYGLSHLYPLQDVLESIMNILEIKTAGVASMKLGAKFLNEWLTIALEDPSRSRINNSRLWRFEEKVRLAYNELKNLKLDTPTPQEYLTAIEFLKSEDTSVDGTEKIAPQILALLEDHFHLQKQWVHLKGGRVIAGIILQFNLTAMAGNITNALGKRHWSVLPPLGIGLGEGVVIGNSQVSGEFQGKRATNPHDFEAAVAYGAWKDTDMDKLLVSRTKSLGFGIQAGSFGNSAYKFLKLRRDYTYLRRRLGVTYLEIPSHLRGQPEAEITPLPFKRK